MPPGRWAPAFGPHMNLPWLQLGHSLQCGQVNDLPAGLLRSRLGLGLHAPVIKIRPASGSGLPDGTGQHINAAMIWPDPACQSCRSGLYQVA
jgi:hypothetical protein